MTVYGAVGTLALLVILPHKLYFDTPLYKPDPLMASLFPPRLDPSIWAAPDFWSAFWPHVLINPFPDNLRTELRDYFGHWGIFWIPIIFLWFAHLRLATRTWERGRRWALGCGLFALCFLAINQMEYVTGPITLMMAVGCLVMSFAFARDVRRAPVWIFLTAAFGWSFFVEVLHFDDEMRDVNERYNSLFKIYYPLWPLMAVGMCAALKELIGRRMPAASAADANFWKRPGAWAGAIALAILVKIVLGVSVLATIAILLGVAVIVAVLSYFPMLETDKGGFGASVGRALCRFAWRIPLLLAVAVLVTLGMLYPIAATATRTSWFHTPEVIPDLFKKGAEKDSYTVRTLDASAYIGNKPEFKDDYAMIQWLNANIPTGTPVIVEWVGDRAYDSNGRFAANTGLPTILGWEHHELQWRGWTKPLPEDLLKRYRIAFGDLLDRRQATPGRPAENIHLTGLLREHVNQIYQANTYDEIKPLLTFYRVRYVLVGALERKAFAKFPAGLDKFEHLPFHKVAATGQTVLYEVPKP